MICGIKVISINAKIIAIKRGNKGLITFSMDVFATPIPTKRTEPTGGVHNPMHRLSTIIIPNWMGLIPRVVTTGKKMGVKIIKSSWGVI